MSRETDSLVGVELPVIGETGAPLVVSNDLRILRWWGARDGIAAIKLLVRHGERPKAYFVLRTHDLERDERLVSFMSQLENVDYDLVPEDSLGMIPDDAADLA